MTIRHEFIIVHFFSVFIFGER